MIAEERAILDALETIAIEANSVADAVAAQDKHAELATVNERRARFLADAKDARDAD